MHPAGFPPGKLGGSDSQGEVKAQNCSIFSQYRSKLHMLFMIAITHTIATKLKEKYDAMRNTMQSVVVDCHPSMRLCDGRMKMSLPKRETATSPWVPFSAKFRPLWQLFCPNTP